MTAQPPIDLDALEADRWQARFLARHRTFVNGELVSDWIDENLALQIEAALVALRTQLSAANARAIKAEADLNKARVRIESLYACIESFEQNYAQQSAELEAVKADRDEALRAEDRLRNFYPTIVNELRKTLATQSALIDKAVEALERIKGQKFQPQFFDKKSEFYGGDHTNYKEREAKAIEALRQAGDVTEVVISEGDWIMLMTLPRMIEIIADPMIRELTAAIGKGEGT